MDTILPICTWAGENPLKLGGSSGPAGDKIFHATQRGLVRLAGYSGCLRLFHNHMTIELVLEVFGGFHAGAVRRLRDVIFEEFAASGGYGLIFTYMWAFDDPSDWEYVEHVKEIFRQRDPDTEFYYVELVAPQAVRLQRNATENRLRHKASKRDIEASNRRLLADDECARCESREGEIPFDNYIRIDNSRLSPQDTAKQIQEHFGL